MLLSIVIPVLNEQGVIGNCLEELQRRLDKPGITEIIVVDGGSKDHTKQEVSNFSARSIIPLRQVTAKKGRAIQLNEGARQARGNILYFIHADSIPPQSFDTRIRQAVHKGKVSGCFRLKFDYPHPVLRVSQWFTRFNWKICRGGDQSLFVDREVFEYENGFNEAYEVYEDCELINRLYDHHSFTVLGDRLETSARKYRKRGTLALQYHFAVIHMKYWIGHSPASLSSYYRRYVNR